MFYKLVLSLCLFAGVILAQVVTGTIQGTIVDSSGGLLVDTSVSVTNKATGFSREGKTDKTGLYHFSFLPTGEYEVRAEKAGFRPAVRTGVAVSVDQKVDIDFTMSLGNVTEAVEVSAAAPLINSTSTELSEVIPQKTIVDLPVRGRNFASLVYLTPGVSSGRVGEQAAAGGPNGWRSNIAFNANGMRATTNSFLLDGVDNNEQGLDFTISVLPVIDAIQEFKVQTSNFSAEFGRALGGIVSVTTRSGSNEHHGTVYEFLRNSAFDARNFFATGAKPAFRQHQFGGAIGGPIVRNRLFYFADYQGQRANQELPFLVTVPTLAVRGGDFAGLGTIYDPLTRQPFPGNRIPSTRIDVPSQIMSRFYPDPNIARGASNFINQPLLTRQDQQGDIRIDHQINERDNYFVRYSVHQTDRLNPSALSTSNNPYGGSPAAGQFSGNASIRAQNISLNYNHVFTPNLVNEFRIGFNRFSISNLPLGFGVNPDIFGIPGLGINSAARTLPLINIAGIAGLGTANVLPDISTSNNFQYLDTVAFTRGRHSIRAGVGAVRRQRNIFIAPTPTGTFNFNSNFTSDQGRAGTGNAFASFLLGYPANTTRSFLLGSQGKRSTEWSAFVQDDIKLGQLTLNLGLRWELYTPSTEVANRQSNLDVQRGVMVPAANNPYGPGLRRTYKKNFGPRVGFAYNWGQSGRTVLRGSYGISYNEELFGLNSFQTLNIPFFIDQTITPGLFVPANRLSDGLPTPILDPNRPSGLIRAINPDFQPGSAQMINFSIQRELVSGLLLESGFVATLGRHLAGFRDLNQSRPGVGPADPRRPLYPIAPLVGRVFYTDSLTNSHYQALLMKLSKRYSKGVSFLASYTFGKTIEGQEGTVAGSFPFPMDSQNLALERSIASFDRTHRFSGSWNWEIPYGRNLHGPARAVLGGWQLSGVLTLATGTPFPISLNTPVSGSNGFTERPDRIRAGSLDDPTRSVERWFDVSAFPIPAVGRFGNAGRNILRAPGQANLDTSLMKDFNFTERWRLQFRAEAYNLTNTPQLGLPNSAIGAPNAGSITSTAGDNRQVQLALKLYF